MGMREEILKATAELMMESPNGDVSTRAICERAGTNPPTIYRQFGDKDGLIAAVVDHAFEQYLATKRDVPAAPDPRETLRQGWDTHAAWALANPAFYWLIFASPNKRSVAAAEAQQILRRNLEELAAVGGLLVSPEVGAQMIMSANVGVCLSMIARPENFSDPALSTRVRDGIHAAVFAEPSGEAAGGTAAQGIRSVAATLGALLPGSGVPLSDTERALLGDWLDRIADDRRP